MKKQTAETHYLDADDGTRIAYTVTGTGTPDIVLSNGIGCNEVFFRYLTRDLEQEHRVVAWHMRGHMDSALPEDISHVGPSYLVGDMKRVLDDAGVEKAVLVGLSMGVELNFEFYRRWPERVAAMIVVNGHYEYPMKSFLGTQTLETFFPLLLFMSRMAPGLFAKGWRTVIGGPWSFWVARKGVVNEDRIRAEDFYDYLPHIRDIDVRCFMEMAYYLAGHSAADLLPNIDVPVLILTGSNDTFTPIAFSQEMAERIPNARLEEIREGSHAMLIEFPEKISYKVKEFLAEGVGV